MKKMRDLENRIAELKNRLELVEGTQTEVYSRIVGYYRPVKNWNKGKREEYGMRKVFTSLEEPQAAPPAQEKKPAVLDHPRGESVSGYLYFYRPSCPNCPPVAEVLEHSGLSGRRIDVDTNTGYSLAEQYNVLAAPTVVFVDPAGKETLRASTTQAVRAATGMAENVGIRV